MDRCKPVYRRLLSTTKTSSPRAGGSRKHRGPLVDRLKSYRSGGAVSPSENIFKACETMLTFMDCPSCGKRVRENASSCHHCGAKFVTSDGDQQDSEHAAGFGEYEESEIGVQHGLPKLWVYTAWILLFAILLPIALSVLKIWDV